MLRRTSATCTIQSLASYDEDVSGIHTRTANRKKIGCIALWLLVCMMTTHCYRSIAFVGHQKRYPDTQRKESGRLIESCGGRYASCVTAAVLRRQKYAERRKPEEIRDSGVNFNSPIEYLGHLRCTDANRKQFRCTIASCGCWYQTQLTISKSP